MTTPDQSPHHSRGGSWLDDITAWAEAADSATSTPAGGYSFEPAELNSIARQWEDLAMSYERDIYLADALAQAEGPGAEYASGDHAQLVRQSGETLLATLQDRIDYCRSQAQKFHQAAGHYAEADTHAGAEITNQGGSL